jgi:hypothetical protein
LRLNDLLNVLKRWHWMYIFTHKYLLMHQYVQSPLPSTGTSHPFWHSPFSPLSVSGTVSTGIIFAFTYMCTRFLHNIHLPTLFLCHLSHPTHWCQPSLLDRTCSSSCAPILYKKNKKRLKEKHGTLLIWDKGSYTGSFLVDTSMYRCIITPIGLCPLIFFILT